MEDELETPEIDEITGSIAYELGETFEHYKVEIESYDDLGDIEMKFQDGTKFRIEVIRMSDEEETNAP